ncbi:MAG: spore coat protein [Ruthenibacterium sp.]
MSFTKKEQDFLKDLQGEEKLCTEKYHKAAEAACDPKLKQIFSKIEQAEQSHYDTVSGMLRGTIPAPQSTKPKEHPAQAQGAKQQQALKSEVSSAKKKCDQYLLSDLLATEKYTAGVYNTAVFEFTDEKARQVLSGIQQQEQHHGKQLADYMMANHMDC